ncbi:MAG: hypothetical protein E6F93_09260 [Actinobacteria bacterium]|nr:MAG: hypothetical protein E6F93_09260 [Actinomycetota bacterium]
MAKSKSPYQSPSAALQPKVTIHEHAPASTIKGAVAGAAAHVNAVNATAAKGASQSGKGK